MHQQQQRQQQQRRQSGGESSREACWVALAGFANACAPKRELNAATQSASVAKRTLATAFVSGNDSAAVRAAAASSSEEVAASPSLSPSRLLLPSRIRSILAMCAGGPPSSCRTIQCQTGEYPMPIHTSRHEIVHTVSKTDQRLCSKQHDDGHCG